MRSMRRFTLKHMAVRGAAAAAFVGAVAMAVCPSPAHAATDYLALREQLEVARPKLQTALQTFLRAPDVAAFSADKPGVAFQRYLDAAWKAIDAPVAFPEVYAALGKFRGSVDAANPVARQALGVMLGDYLQVRYGADVQRELRALIAFQSFNTVVDKNSDNPEVRKAFDAIADLATRLGLQAKNHAYETLQVTLASKAAGPAVAVYTHADVAKPVDHKWDSPPYELKKMNERWVGLGVYDGKGPIIVNLFALRVLRDAGLKLARPAVLLVSANGEEADASAASSIAVMTTKPAIVLAADGEFPYATGEMGHLVARVSSTRGMKSRAGIKPGEFYVWKAQCVFGTSTVPMEARVWVRYDTPLNTDNPSSVMVNQKWRPAIEAFQKLHPATIYETYVQEDTLHFFAYGNPQHVMHADRAENSVVNASGAIWSLPGLFKNSASDVMWWIDRGYARDVTGKTVGLDFSDPEMGHCWVSPVAFDRLGEEFTSLVDIRWPAGHTAADVKQRVQASIEAFNKQNSMSLALDWEAGGHEPARISPSREITSVLEESAALASGEVTPPVAATASAARLLPETIPFGPQWPRSEPRGHTRNESISQRELQDLCVAYVAALARLATAATLPATP